MHITPHAGFTVVYGVPVVQIEGAVRSGSPYSVHESTLCWCQIPCGRASVQLEFRTLGYGLNSLKCVTGLVFEQHAKSDSYDNLLRPFSHSSSKFPFSDNPWIIPCKDPFSPPTGTTSFPSGVWVFLLRLSQSPSRGPTGQVSKGPRTALPFFPSSLQTVVL